MSSECCLSDLVFSNVIVNESLFTSGSNNGVKYFHYVTFHTLVLHSDLPL